MAKPEERSDFDEHEEDDDELEEEEEWAEEEYEDVEPDGDELLEPLDPVEAGRIHYNQGLEKGRTLGLLEGYASGRESRRFDMSHGFLYGFIFAVVLYTFRGCAS